MPGKSGNISMKFKNDEFEQIAVTPSGLSLKSLDENDIVIVDMEGNLGLQLIKNLLLNC